MSHVNADYRSATATLKRVEKKPKTNQCCLNTFSSFNKLYSITFNVSFFLIVLLTFSLTYLNLKLNLKLVDNYMLVF